jgi:CotH protein
MARRTWVHALLVAVALAGALPGAATAQTDPAAPFFDDSVIHDLKITINSKDWQSLKDHWQENNYYPCDFRWQDVTVRNIGIRPRGNGSRNPVKVGLRVDFDRYSTDQKFLGMRSFILRNNTQDASNVREITSMAFFRRMGIPAPRESFARLFINNAYVGLYTIVESYDKRWLQSTYGESDGYLYEWDFDEQADIPYSFDYRGSDPAVYVPLPFKPETHETDPHAEVIEQFLWTVNEAGDAAWRQSMAEFLDLPAFMRRLAIENFLGEEDGITGDYGPNNFYIYRFVNKKLHVFLPWDKSNVFWENADYSIFRNVRSGPEAKRNKLVVRAMRHPDLLNAYLDALLEAAGSAAEASAAVTASTVRKNGLTARADGPGWLERQVTRYYELIRTAAREDTVKPFSNDEFEAAVVAVKAFAKDRSQAVKDQVAGQRP